MNDEFLGPAYEALSNGVTPPPDANEQVAKRMLARRRIRQLTAVAITTGVVIGAGATASLVLGDGRTSTGPSTDVPAVSCPDGRVIRTPERDSVRVPALDSPDDAARAWAGPAAGRVEVRDGVGLLLRDDGTVRATMTLTSTRTDLERSEPTAWSVNGSEVCSSETSLASFTGEGLLECAEDSVVQTSVRPPETPGSLTALEEARSFSDPTTDETELQPTTGSRSGDLTALLVRDGTVHTVLRVVRLDDTWHLRGLAACSSELPGLRPVSETFRLLVGHCWVEPVTYDGGEWDVVEEDQFGWGGGMPRSWVGIGTITPAREGTLRYVDAGGVELRLVRVGDPRAIERGGCD
ncbi:MAG TPA: hypothetical protein VLI04_15985 [Nocardioidaceae bacterium]|nr:hypothetical protein [Nocardioidaceae bacterium]